jgi:hypothetical protein
MIYCPSQMDSDQDDILEVDVDQEDLEGMELDEPIPMVPRRGGGDRVDQDQVNSTKKGREFEKSQYIERRESATIPKVGQKPERTTKKKRRRSSNPVLRKKEKYKQEREAKVAAGQASRKTKGLKRNRNRSRNRKLKRRTE